MRSVSDPRNVPPSRPYSPAVVVGSTVYVSGHVAFDGTGRVVGTSLRDQARQVLVNVENTLESAGATRRDIVSTNVYLTSMEDIDEFDLIYREFFGDGPYPARTAVEVSALPRPQFRIEMSAIAVID